jgi:hypothetical protein
MRRNPLIQFFINLICHDFWRKLVALFLALLLYLAIAPRTSEKREKSFSNVPVEIELPANVALSSGERPKVKVTIHGNIKALDEVDPGLLRIRAEVHADADRLIPGEAYLLRLRFDDVSGLPYGARVTSISPRDLPLNLERVVSKQLEVKARYDSQEKLLPELAAATMQMPACPVYCNYEARPVTGTDDVRAMLGAQVCGSVRWAASMQDLVAKGHTLFIEMGPGKTLAGMMGRICKDVTVISIEDVPTLQAAIETLKAQA